MEEIGHYNKGISMPVLLNDTVQRIRENLPLEEQNRFVFQLIDRLKTLREAEFSDLQSRQKEIRKSLSELPSIPKND